MKAMILAAGEGTRLRPLTLTCPKPMLPVGERPLLEYNITRLRNYGIRDIAINLHYLPEVVTNYFGDGRRWGVALHYSFEETLLGSAGAIKKLASFFDEPFVVMYGDLFTFIDLAQLIAHHQRLAAQVTIAVQAVDNPVGKGIVELDRHGWITRFAEKPKVDQIFSNLANAGVYVLEPEVVQWIPAQAVSDFGHDIFPWLIENRKRVAGYHFRELLIDIGTMANYERAQQFARPVGNDHSLQ
jgi:NDP-sugar pyrophosphorylase family protein